MREPVKFRQMIERRILRKTAQALLKAGYQLGINDSEEVTISHSRSLKDIMAASMTTDEDWLLVYAPDSKPTDEDPRPMGWVRFIYGNSGWDVINDYTTNLDPIMDRMMAYVDKIEERYFS